MAKRTLIYRWDEQEGRMRVHSLEIQLGERDRAALELELRRQYESLLGRLDRGESELVIAFSAAWTESRRIAAFRVRYARAVRARCPALILEPVFGPVAEPRRPAPPRATASMDTPGGKDAEEPSFGLSLRTNPPGELADGNDSPWPAGLMKDLKRQLSEPDGPQLPKRDRAVLAFAYSELHDLCRDHPDRLAIVLLAGYVALGERKCGQLRPEDAAWFRSAARVLDQFCGWEFAKYADQPPPVPCGPPDDIASRVRRVTQFLSRALGLHDDWE